MLVTRDGRVLVGERGASVPFMSGFVAFPGGRVEPSDASFFPTPPGDPAIAREVELGLGPDDDGRVHPHTFRAAALRELVEEVGLLFAGGRTHAVPAALRSKPLAEICAALGVRLDPRELVFGGRWVTPGSSPVRFDTRFYLAITDAPDVEPTPSDEFAWARFEPIDALLAAWRRFERLIGPPTRYALEVLALGLDDAPRRLSAIPEARGESNLEFLALPGIGVIPLRTPTLPPAQHTNTYILGEERLLVVDPATYEPSEREVLLDRITDRTNAGARVEAIVLTHHHHDHVGAASWLRETLGVPVLAHAKTKALLEGDVTVDATIDEGHVFDLGRWCGPGPFLVDVLHTPGHAPGHVVLVDRRSGARAMIVGDMIAGIGTIVIDPPEGDMFEYLAQLRRLRAMPNAILFPAHGPGAIDGHAKLDQYVAHRLMREDKVVTALERAHRPSTPRALLEDAYADTPPALYPLAARSCLAHLEKLVRDGRATRDGDHFQLR